MFLTVVENVIEHCTIFKYNKRSEMTISAYHRNKNICKRNTLSIYEFQRHTTVSHSRKNESIQVTCITVVTFFSLITLHFSFFSLFKFFFSISYFELLVQIQFFPIIIQKYFPLLLSDQLKTLKRVISKYEILRFMRIRKGILSRRISPFSRNFFIPSPSI